MAGRHPKSARVNLAAVRPASVSDLKKVAKLWSRLDEFHRGLGLDIPRTSGAAAKWVASFERTLGRFSFLWVAEDGGRVVGFALARIKQAPAIYGGGLIGEISDIYIDDSARGRGLAGKLADVALAGLRSAGALSVEVQVITGNEAGLKFWESQGFQVRLRQLTKAFRR
ncbi:GNAT family N-acetyltransferase [bacterium]|nr:MAG: GNAT family N-acetyltransferase [bacterium]